MEAALKFDAEQHVYSLGGRNLPNVTNIIRPLQEGFDRIPPAVLEHARERGQAVHRAVLFHNENDLDIETLDLEIVPYFEAWIRF